MFILQRKVLNGENKKIIKTRCDTLTCISMEQNDANKMDEVSVS